MKNIWKHDNISPLFLFTCGVLLIALALWLKLESVAIVMFLALFVGISPKFLKSLLKILSILKTELGSLIDEIESPENSPQTYIEDKE